MAARDQAPGPNQYNYVLMLRGGKPVFIKDKKKLYDDAQCIELVGVPLADHPKQKNVIDLNRLSEFASAPVDNDPHLLLRKCRAAALLAIGSMIMQDASANIISSKFLQLVENVDDIKGYAHESSQNKERP
ncbi:uncharacterized protein DS421_12g388280 [Arachis hypogaea]|nr:uncharacterized protein DS421_12g388280 [Arachis hypogaea]